MAYDEALAQRIRKSLGSRRGLAEKKMFGGVAFLLRGHMFAGISGRSLMARVGPDGYERALARKHVREMDFTGRPLRGYVFVDAKGIEGKAALDAWLRQCMSYVATLPRKAAK